MTRDIAPIEQPCETYGSRHRVSLPTVLVVAVVHVVLGVLLVRAFAPELAGSVAQAAYDGLAVTFTPQPPPPPEEPVEPAPNPGRLPEPEGAQAAAGKAAEPAEQAAPAPKVVVKETRPVPPVAGEGKDALSGAAQSGDGTGASGTGLGTGAGRSGTGQGGGGGGSPTVKIAGDINSARDYPRASRDLRIGHSVVVELGVGADGRVSSCRVYRASPDAEADRITCALAQQRFRFRPATDAAGRAVPSIYHWQQRWFVR
ncbi:TonB family protein [Novosphingobium profundi]|uniref:TonB family protein n=1 Tax=Novosphingobium profundi TaxID=1774954 RepID=UPI001BD9BA5A|nr:TonB family protein [Novosphingobium profundi]MBT0666959.1 TonB family protein [Novosphingobium profundi]